MARLQGVILFVSCILGNIFYFPLQFQKKAVNFYHFEITIMDAAVNTPSLTKTCGYILDIAF